MDKYDTHQILLLLSLAVSSQYEEQNKVNKEILAMLQDIRKNMSSRDDSSDPDHRPSESFMIY